MRINVFTVGQNVCPTGKHRHKTGYIRRLYFFADSTQAGYVATVRIAGVGVRDYPVSALAVRRVS